MTARAAADPRTFDPKIREELANTIKGLTIDAIECSKSGHPGMPMGCADLASVLWSEFLVHDPQQPQWFNRDRFVLSAGHGSMLLYALLHLSGYDLPLDEIRNFRQWDSKTPGHPEFGHTVGVEVTTGPLGTGFATGVGLAIAEQYLGARYNQPGHEIVDHLTYAVVSDGDLMEGVCAEAASLAGHLGLGKIIYLYDDNQISIDGSTDLSFGEDVKGRFEAYGWQVQRVDGHDPAAIREALKVARAETARPSLICCRTVIGQGSPSKAGKSASHGAPLGAEDAAGAKAAMGWSDKEAFHVPAPVREGMAQVAEGLSKERADWEAKFEAYASAHPELAKEFKQLQSGELPESIWKSLPSYEVGSKIATRAVSGAVINALAAQHPTFVGGSADLAGSNKTLIKEGGDFSKENRSGRNLYFGVREHAMAAVCNGIALHGGLRCFDATFLIFSDFMRGAMRLSALMNLPVVHVLTHDSFWVGEDGPTHQPIEQTMSLRLMPNMHVYRPADAQETVGAWKAAMERKDGPSAILLSRQNLPVLAGSKRDISEGAYLLWEPQETKIPDAILIATGSEVALALEVAQEAHKDGKKVRVVSMPCRERFEACGAEVHKALLPEDVPLSRRISIEAGVTCGWGRYAGVHIGIDHFGASAPGGVLAEKFGFTKSAVRERLNQVLEAKA